MMKFIKGFFIFVIILILAAAGCVFYAFRIEPFRLAVKEYAFGEDKEEASELKVVQFSDLHIKEDFTEKNLKKVVDKINAQTPDVVIFTGDLYDNYAVYHDDAAVIRRLSDIKAGRAKLAVWGNRDYGGGAARHYENIMEQAGFTLLRNENWYVTADNGRKVLFTGLDDSIFGEPFMPEDTKIYESDFEVLLMHEPDTVKDYADDGYEAALGGHSHGGQINVPFLPFVNKMAVSATNLASEYSGGMYELSEDGSSKLYVNTGIGTTHISARFGVTPEITVFHIYL